MPEASRHSAKARRRHAPPSRWRTLLAVGAASTNARAAAVGLVVVAVVTTVTLGLPRPGLDPTVTAGGVGVLNGIASTSIAEQVPSPSAPAVPPTTTTAPLPAPSVPPKARKVPPPAPSPASSAPAPAPAPAPVPAAGDPSAVNAVLAALNDARSAAGLAPVALDSSLSAAAAAHNRAMAGAGQLSHQLPGEAALGDRITAAGFAWSFVAENVGVSGGGSATEAALSLTASMLAEQPPDDGHRRNLLSPEVTHVGIDVYVAGGQVWLTHDFAAA